VAGQIAKLIQAGGAEVFLDAFDIQAGDNFNERIQRETERCTEAFVLLTPWAMKSKYVWVELGAFLGRGKRIVVALHGVTVEKLAQQNTAFLSGIDMININRLDQYFRELKQRSSAS
jgi:hypothetical protein